MSSGGFGWRDRVVGNVARTSEVRVRRTKAVSRLTMEVTVGIMPLLMEACRRRQISPTGYIRRAMLAFIAHDLNRPLEDVLVHDPRFSPPGSRIVVPDPEGKMGGPWEIEDLR
jgi:hypothetical protein